MKSDAFVFACRENPEVFRALEYILDVSREKALEAMANQVNHDEICRFQGFARGILGLKKELANQVRLRDGAGEQSRVRAVR